MKILLTKEANGSNKDLVSGRSFTKVNINICYAQLNVTDSVWTENYPIKWCVINIKLINII